MGQPHEAAEIIEDEEFERSWERVAAVDVAKASGVVCARVPDEDHPGRHKTRVWAVAATIGEVTGLGDHLRCQGIEVVTIESTSDYWRIWHGVLEAAGLKVQLVNARAVKNVPGRAKTDKKDAVWLAKLTERGMLQPSFIPPHDIRVLREYTRLRAELVRERTRHWSRMEKLLERALIKLTSVASSIDTVSARKMIEALIAGERSPARLADLARGVMRNRRKDLIAALDGKFEDHHGEEARILLGHIDALTRDIARLEDLAAAQVARIPASWGIDPDGTTGPGAGKAPDAAVLPAVARLDEITGCGPVAATAIIAEIGLDMTVFGSPGRLVSWAKLCPQTRQSGKKTTAGSPGKGDPGSRAPSARSPPLRPALTPTLASGTAASPAGAASEKPSSPPPAPSSSSSTTSSLTPPPASATSAPATTRTASAPSARSATTSASSKPSASPSPSPPPRTPPSPIHRQPAGLRRSMAGVRCRLPAERSSFRSAKNRAYHDVQHFATSGVEGPGPPAATAAEIRERVRSGRESGGGPDRWMPLERPDGRRRRRPRRLVPGQFRRQPQPPRTPRGQTPDATSPGPRARLLTLTGAGQTSKLPAEMPRGLSYACRLG
jgi:transposase